MMSRQLLLHTDYNLRTKKSIMKTIFLGKSLKIATPSRFTMVSSTSTLRTTHRPVYDLLKGTAVNTSLYHGNKTAAHFLYLHSNHEFYLHTYSPPSSWRRKPLTAKFSFQPRLSLPLRLTPNF